jgi:hypothetical protein
MGLSRPVMGLLYLYLYYLKIARLAETCRDFENSKNSVVPGGLL